jgi:glycosyltransferase involved in cell wall biosynthesis
MMDVVFFGGYDPAYPRNAVLRRGLELNGARVSECRAWPLRRFWRRYPVLVRRWLGLRKAPKSPLRFIFVPEFAQKDVPLARLLGRLTSRLVVFDPLASRYETKILDWRRKPEGSPSARWNRAIDRRAFRSSDLIIADTEAHREYYAREFAVEPGRVSVIPVGFDDRVFSEELREASPASPDPKAPFTVLFFGSFLPLHGVDAVIEAARLVSEADSAVMFRFIGSGQTHDRVRGLAEKYQLANAGFEGWLSQTELAARVARTADICLGLFGRTEKAERVVPHKIFQSMALGKPVVTARTPAAEEFFRDREHILLCRKDEPRGLAEAILELKKDPALRERIARNGRELVWRKYQPAALGALLEDVLTKAAESEKGSHAG